MAVKISDVPATYNPQQWRQIVRDIDSRFAKLEASVGKYTVSNFTPLRTLNAGTATTTQLANFVATLVSDLQQVGRLGE